MLSIAVITPSLNQARFVEATIRSVLDQAYPALEYVVVDGGSTDGTRDVLERAGAQVRWTSEPDGGQSEAINKGIRATSSDIVGWLSSDDLYRPGALAAIAAYFAEHPDVEVVYGEADMIDEAGGLHGRYMTAAWDSKYLAQRCFISQPAAFVRRRVLEQHGALDEHLHYCMDYDLWLRLARANVRFAHVPNVLAAMRQHPATKTLGSRLAVHNEIDAVLRRHTGRVPDGWLVNHAHTWLELRGITSARTPLRFGLCSAVLYIALAMRWNGWPTRDLVLLGGRRIAGGVLRRFGLLARSSA